MKFSRKNNNVKGLILAAGRGSRLDDLTMKKPKCYIKISGKTLIDYQIEALKKSGIKDIAIVTGYLYKHFKNIKSTKFLNEKWKTTNMVYSMLCARDWFDKDVIVSYSDIIFPYKIVKKIVSCKEDFVIAADLNWKKLWKKRFKNPFDDAETFKMHNNYLTEIGNRTNSYKNIEAQFIGLFKVSCNGFKIISDMIKKKIISKNHDFTQTFQKIINQNHKVKVVLLNEKWFEIDNIKDMVIAEDHFSNLKIR